MFEELDDERRSEFLRNRSDGDVAALLCRLATDDAVDLRLEDLLALRVRGGPDQVGQLRRVQPAQAGGGRAGARR
jgi:hypothetical protein